MSIDRETVLMVDGPLYADNARILEELSSRIRIIEYDGNGNLSKANVYFGDNIEFDPDDAPHLQWVQLRDAGIEHVVGLPIAHAGIPICSVVGALAAPVAEAAIALLLSLTRNMQALDRLQEKKRWPDSAERSILVPKNCHGMTVGILGYGSIGRHIARIASAMGMRILAYKRRPEIRKEALSFRLPDTGDPEGVIPNAWYGIGQIREMLPQCQVVINTLPDTDATRDLLGKRELELIPCGSYLINVGRGAVINEEALIDVAGSGRFAGVGLDVFLQEPLPKESPVWDIPNVIISPHMGSWCDERDYLAEQVLVENMIRYESGRPLVSVSDIDNGY